MVVEEQKMIRAWERKIFQKIYGEKRKRDGWVRRANREIQEQRLRWLGPITRMDAPRMARRIVKEG